VPPEPGSYIPPINFFNSAISRILAPAIHQIYFDSALSQLFGKLAGGRHQWISVDVDVRPPLEKSIGEKKTTINVARARRYGIILKRGRRRKGR
jgi:hypothetical protein